MTDLNVDPDRRQQRRRGMGCAGVLGLMFVSGALSVPVSVMADASLNDSHVTHALENWAPRINGPRQTDASDGSLPLTVGTPSATPSKKHLAKKSASPTASSTTEDSDDNSLHQPVIVIDPGHSGDNVDSDKSDKQAINISPAAVTYNGETYYIRDHDYPNHPEMEEVFKVSSCVEQALTIDGYKVVMTKKSAGDTVSLADRAKIAENAGGKGVPANLAISVHNDHGQTPSQLEAYYTQAGLPGINGKSVDQYRTSVEGKKIVFTNDEVAEKSAEYGEIIGDARSKAQGYAVKERQTSLAGRSGLADGNIWLVQLLANGTPWIYNEMGAETDGSLTKPLDSDKLAAYALGLTNGIEKAVPIQDKKMVGAKSIASCIQQ